MLNIECIIFSGKKNGFEAKLRKVCPNLLDIDGESAHHMSNIAKEHCGEFERDVENLLRDLYRDHTYSTDQRDYLKQVISIQVKVLFYI